MENIDFEKLGEECLTQIAEITEHYTNEERIAFLQGIMAMVQVCEAFVHLMPEDFEENDEILDEINELKEYIMETVKEL